MSFLSYLVFALLVMGASGIQRVTGFSFALFVVAGSTVLELGDLWEITVVVTFLLCINATTGLTTSNARPKLMLLMVIMAGVVPGTLIGLLLIHNTDYISDEMASFCLGIFMMLTAFMLGISTTSKSRWGNTSMWALGGIAGITGGAFGTPGPPLVYGFYRQSIPLEEIRATLFAVFLGFAAFRSGAAFYSAEVTPNIMWMFTFALPATLVGARVGRKVIKVANDHNIRGGAIGILFISGLIVMIRA